MAKNTTKHELANTETATNILRERIYNFINRSGNAGVTDEEIRYNFGVNGDTARPRRVELVKMDMVASSGRRRHTLSGRTATIWKSTRVLSQVAKTAAKKNSSKRS